MEEDGKAKATEDGEEISDFSLLPEGVVAKILSLTTPSDACRSSAVSRTFVAAVQSDMVWNTFLPIDWEFLVSRGKPNNLNFDPILSSKKEIFLSLCDTPLLIDDGNKSVSLEKWSGKKCVMLGARDLSIVWGDTSQYWSWEHHPDSRFAEVAALLEVWWLEIRGRVSCRMLSPKTTYAVYLVFKMRKRRYFGFDIDPAVVTVEVLDIENHQRSVCLDPYLDNPWGRQRRRRHALWMLEPQLENMSGLDRPQERHDGWFEVEMGEFESGDGDDAVEMAVKEVSGSSAKGGLVVEGIEIRPKSSRPVV